MVVTSLASTPRKSPSRYDRLSQSSKTQLSGLDVRKIKPDALKKLASALYADRVITLTQKAELEFMRKPYAADSDNSAFNLVEAVGSLNASAGEVQKRVPGSDCVSYYKSLLQVTQWIDQVTKAHPNKVRRFSAWA